MRFEWLQRRLSSLEHSYGERAFSVTLERAIFKKGEARVVGTLVVKAGAGGYHAV